MGKCIDCEHHVYEVDGKLELKLKCQYGHIKGNEQPKECKSYEEI